MNQSRVNWLLFTLLLLTLAMTGWNTVRITKNKSLAESRSMMSDNSANFQKNASPDQKVAQQVEKRATAGDDASQFSAQEANEQSKWIILNDIPK